MSLIPCSALLQLTQRELGSIGEWRLLSTSNSTVWRVETSADSFVVKHLTDTSSDALLEQRLISQLGSDPLFHPIDKVRQCDDGSVLVISRYLNGVSLDQVLQDESYNLQDANRWANQMHQIFTRLSEVPVTGFGRSRAENFPSYTSWMMFMQDYLKGQKKKAPRLASLRFEAIHKAFQRADEMLEPLTRHPFLIPADVNSRNFMVTSPHRDLVMLNIPVVWHGDPVHPYGEALIHLDETPVLERLLSLVDFPCWQLSLYAALSAYVILSYVERFGTQPLDQVTPWGRQRPLLQLLDEYLNQLKFTFS